MEVAILKIGSIQGLFPDERKIDIKFQVVFESNEIVIEFYEALPNNLEIKNNLFITEGDGNELTFLACGLKQTKYKGTNQITALTVYFNTCLNGITINSFEELACKSLSFEIDSDPIPLLHTLPKKSFQLNGVSLEFRDSSNPTGISCILTPSNTDVSVSELETIFFEICNILFLCLGFYPYIKSQNILYDERIVEIFHLYPNKYIKGNSPSHWTSEITFLRDINLSVAHYKYTQMFKENNIIIEVLSNAVHSKGLYIDLLLSTLVQCVEGYMRTWHKRKKFSDETKNKIIELILPVLNNWDGEKGSKVSITTLTESIRGLLGNINSPSLKECLQDAFEFNNSTKKIIKREIDTNEYKHFINKSGAVRNQFSHMAPKKNRFSDLGEIIRAFEKYKLLLRVLILADLDISPINIDRLIAIIDNQ